MTAGTAVATGLLATAVAVTGLVAPTSSAAADSGSDGARAMPVDDAGVPTPSAEPTTRPEPCPPTSGVLTVADYNIKGGKAYGGNKLPEIAETLKAWNADVVMLQEVDRFRPGSGNVDQAAWLAEQLGYEHVFGANVRGAGEYGTAILSRYPILDSSNTPLPNARRGEPRGLLHAVVDAPGEEISVYSTHLQHMRSYSDLRQLQVAAVLDQIEDDEHPVVLGGDLNAGPPTPEIQALSEGLDDSWLAAETLGDVSAFTAPVEGEEGEGDEQDAGADVPQGVAREFADPVLALGRTSPATGPGVRIDYLFHRDLDVLGAAVAPEQLSDHLAVRAAYSYAIEEPEDCATPKPSPSPTPTATPTPSPTPSPQSAVPTPTRTASPLDASR